MSGTFPTSHPTRRSNDCRFIASPKLSRQVDQRWGRIDFDLEKSLSEWLGVISRSLMAVSPTWIVRDCPDFLNENDDITFNSPSKSGKHLLFSNRIIVSILDGAKAQNSSPRDHKNRGTCGSEHSKSLSRELFHNRSCPVLNPVSENVFKTSAKAICVPTLFSRRFLKSLLPPQLFRGGIKQTLNVASGPPISDRFSVKKDYDA
jgi:hypothetical protein